MANLPVHVTISLLEIEGRGNYGRRVNDVQTIYRCSPGERKTILKAAYTVGMSGAEFMRTVMIQVAAHILLDGVETKAKVEIRRQQPLKLSAAKAPGAKR